VGSSLEDVDTTKEINYFYNDKKYFI